MVGKICEKVGLEPGVKERGSYGSYACPLVISYTGLHSSWRLQSKYVISSF